GDPELRWVRQLEPREAEEPGGPVRDGAHRDGQEPGRQERSYRAAPAETKRDVADSLAEDDAADERRQRRRPHEREDEASLLLDRAPGPRDRPLQERGREGDEREEEDERPARRRSAVRRPVLHYGTTLT